MLFVKYPELEARVWYRILILSRYSVYGLALFVLFGGLLSALNTGDIDSVLLALGSSIIPIFWWGVEKIILYLFLGPSFFSKPLWNKSVLVSSSAGGLGILVSALVMSFFFRENIAPEKAFKVPAINLQTEKIEFVDPLFLKSGIDERKYALIRNELYKIKRDYPYYDIITMLGDGAVREIQSSSMFQADFADASSIYDFKIKQQDKDDVKRFAKMLLFGMILGSSAYLRSVVKKPKTVTVTETTEQERDRG